MSRPSTDRSEDRNVGENNPQARLTEGTVREIDLRLQRGERQVDLAREFGVDQSRISRIKTRTDWAHILDPDVVFPKREYRRRTARNLPRLAATEVAEIRRLLASGETQVSVAARFGRCQKTVSNIALGKCYASVGGAAGGFDEH